MPFDYKDRGLVLGICKKEVTPPLAQAKLAVDKSSLCSNPSSRT